MPARHPLMLVSAPAGFGKATLLSDWLGHCSTSSAWLSLDTTSSYLPRLLAAFDAEQERVAGRVPASKPPAAAARWPADQTALIEPLTQRELEVLELLSERLSNNEIAVELNLSPATVKRHTVNIYQKLAVGSRREAGNLAY